MKPAHLAANENGRRQEKTQTAETAETEAK